MGILRKMKVAGLDVTKHKDALTSADMKKLYESGVLTTQTPLGLLRKVYMEVSLHFARRGMEGLRQLTKESFMFLKDAENKEYVTMAYNEIEKNHQVQAPKEQEKKQLMFAQEGDAMCPVATLKKYISKLNPKCTALFQKPKQFAGLDYETEEVWYENKPMGVNTLATLMKKISKDADLCQIYTNHSIRATAATVLSSAGIDSRNICAVTGHKNVASLTSYITAPTMAQRNEMSTVLHNYGKNEVSCVENVINTSPANYPSLTKSSYAAGALFAGANFNAPTTVNVNINNA